MTATTAAVFPGACDCHIHLFEDQYPLVPTATYKPPHAPASHYSAVRALLGLQRVVVVQPTGYGFDNTCTLQGMRALGDGSRGVAVIDAGIDERELDALHAAGMRGVRFMMLSGGVLGWDALVPTAARIAPLGWNINLQLDGRRLPVHEAMLMKLPCRLVIDHIGKFLEGPVKSDDPAFQSLRRLLDTGRCWIKISGPYESSRTGPPGYDDVAVLARELVAAYPERCLWASNWPHPNVQPAPSNTDLLRWFLDIAGRDSVRQKILVANPAEVYGF